MLKHFKSPILVQMVLYFSNSFSSSKRKDINSLFLSLSLCLTLNALTFILGNTETNSLITLSKYLIKYLEFLFQLILRYLYYQH